MVKNLPASAGDTRDSGSVLGLGRYPGEGGGNPLQYSCLENPIDRGAWWATVYGVTKSQTRLSTFSTTINIFRVMIFTDNTSKFTLRKNTHIKHFQIFKWQCSQGLVPRYWVGQKVHSGVFITENKNELSGQPCV